MMMATERRPILLANARILDPSRDLDIDGDLLIADAVIREAKRGIGPAGGPEATEVIDCKGKLVAPGLVDMRAFVGEPGADIARPSPRRARRPPPAASPPSCPSPTPCPRSTIPRSSISCCAGRATPRSCTCSPWRRRPRGGPGGQRAEYASSSRRAPWGSQPQRKY